MTSQLVTSDVPAPPAPAPARRMSRVFPWAVFALTFGLLLADYMSRQVLSAVFPLLKSEWSLSDAHLASLTSVVALAVGVLTLPLSIVADRWGRTRSIVVMAVLWSAATVLCAVAQNYEQMLGARLLVGVGEAAYGSVGIALVLGVFHSRMHAALGGAFMAGGSFGSVVGVALGGVIAVQFGWRWAFVTMAVLGLVLVVVFRVVVTERRLERHAVHEDEVQRSRLRMPLSTLFTNPSVLCAYVGGGLQMFTAAVLLSWTPSFFNRSYGLATAQAATAAAGIVLLVGAGMVVCGIVTDRVGRTDITRKWLAGVAFCAIALAALGAAFLVGTGPAQIVLLCVGAFFSAGSSGPTAAMVANLTHESVRSSAMGTLTVANNLLGLALGPFIVGVLADHLGLTGALRLAPLFYIPAILALLLGRRMHPASLRRLAARIDRESAAAARG